MLYEADDDAGSSCCEATRLLHTTRGDRPGIVVLSGCSSAAAGDVWRRLQDEFGLIVSTEDEDASSGPVDTWGPGPQILTSEQFWNVIHLAHHGEAAPTDPPRAAFIDTLNERVAVRLAKAQEVRGTLADQLTPRLAELDPVPHAAVEQARRYAQVRAHLLTQGAFTYRALAEGRDQAVDTVRQSVNRARRRAELFTVAHDRETLVPAFLLDAALDPHPHFQPAIKPLVAAGEDGWALWAWFDSPSAWLDGARPADLASSDAEAVADAARRRASNVE